MKVNYNMSVKHSDAHISDLEKAKAISESAPMITDSVETVNSIPHDAIGVINSIVLQSTSVGPITINGTRVSVQYNGGNGDAVFSVYLNKDNWAKTEEGMAAFRADLRAAVVGKVASDYSIPVGLEGTWF